MRGWFEEVAARRAIDRCYGLPYLREVSPREYCGLTRLERRGIVERDAGGGGGTYWHLTEAGRRWLVRNGRYWP